MVKLDIKDYCQTCPYFEADVSYPPTLYYENDKPIYEDGDTIVRCVNREHCEFVKQGCEKSFEEQLSQNANINKHIYSSIGEPYWDDLFKKVEMALGFKLFVWQKTFIVFNNYRKSGKTTAEVLSVLLKDKDKPFYVNIPPTSIQESFFIRALKETKSKLDEAGIKTREIKFKGE